MCPDNPVWNLPEALFALARAGDESLVPEIIAIFRDDTARRLTNLQQAFEAGDTSAVREQAHAIKGSAAQVGAASMASCCREIECCAAGSRTTPLGPLVHQLHRDFKEVCEAMARNYG